MNLRSIKISTPILAFALLLIQFTLVFLLTPQGSTGLETYLKLNNWDSFHYQQIASDGYQIPKTSITSDDIHSGIANLVFFPGYPILVRVLNSITGIPISYSLLLVAQLSCFFFWFYFIKILKQKNISDPSILMGALLICLHPGAFFLVVGYTESLFLGSTLGFIYWSDRWLSKEQGKISFSWWVSVLHGLLMSLTKIVALPVFIYPLLKSRAFKNYWRSILLGAASSLGAASFFLFSYLKFNEWNLYFRLEEIGWGNYKNWFALLDPWSYIPRFFFEHTVDSFNRAAVPFTVGLFVIAFLIEKMGKNPTERLGLYFTSFFLFYIPLTGKANANMDSMIRYSFPSFVLIVIALLQFQKQNPNTIQFRKFRSVITIGGILSFSIQLWFIFRFLRGKWVA